MDAEDLAGSAVGALLGDDLHHAIGLADDLGAAVATEGVLLHDDVDAALLGGGFGQTTEGDFGVRVDRPRHAVVVNRDDVLTDDGLDGDDCFSEGHVGQLRRAGHDVTDGEDVGVRGAHVAVGHDEAAVVNLDAGALAKETLGAGATADRDDHHVNVEVVGTVEGHGGALLTGLVARDLGGSQNVNAALLERALHDGGDFRVATGED